MKEKKKIKGEKMIMAKSSSKDYFSLSPLVSLILAIIPVTSWVLGVLTRFQEGKIVAAIVRVLVGWNIIWILDIVFMVTKGRIFRLLDI